MIKKIISFVLESVQETIHKVVWPSYKAIQFNSILVLVASFLFAVVVGIIDLGLRNIVSWFYSIF